MAINQLFKSKPPFNLVLKICLYFGIDLEDLSKKNSFTKNELVKLDLETKFPEFEETLKQYYIPCKCKIYLNNITISKSVTILRQLLKLYNFKISSNESYNNSKKYIIYVITQNENKQLTNNGVIKFD
tara:strand:+ start:2289 stop:2672 length:384 start_codon:yes stop_codon:yes gene_type:complete